MPGYIVLLKWTQQGLASIKSAPERMRQTKAAAEKAGIKSVGTWVTLGEYDMVTVADAPDDQAVATAVLQIARQGNATTRTMRALSEEEFAQVVSKLP